MTAPEQDARVRQAELIISNVLRAGVVASVVLIMVGSVLTFLHHPGYLSLPGALASLTQPDLAPPHTLRGVAAGIRHLQGQAIVEAGLLLLILTPVARVAVSILAFRAQHDRTYVMITSTVLALLILSFLLGRPAG